MTQTVRVERDGAIVTVVLDRPEVGNALDRADAETLSEAFRAFDADDSAAVAVLWGSAGTFCAGADLKSLAAADGNRFAPDGDGPMGPARMALSCWTARSREIPGRKWSGRSSCRCTAR
jgi:enoyl-CoA hydratase